MSIHVDLIEAIGRTELAQAVAARRGMNWNDQGHRKRAMDMIYRWIDRGVTPLWRPFVDRLARERGLEHAIPAGFLDPTEESPPSAELLQPGPHDQDAAAQEAPPQERGDAA